MMRFINAKIHGGRLTLDEPTELPAGTLVGLIPTDTGVRQRRAADGLVLNGKAVSRTNRYDTI